MVWAQSLLCTDLLKPLNAIPEADIALMVGVAAVATDPPQPRRKARTAAILLGRAGATVGVWCGKREQVPSRSRPSHRINFWRRARKWSCAPGICAAHGPTSAAAKRLWPTVWHMVCTAYGDCCPLAHASRHHTRAPRPTHRLAMHAAEIRLLAICASSTTILSASSLQRQPLSGSARSSHSAPHQCKGSAERH